MLRRTRTVTALLATALTATLSWGATAQAHPSVPVVRAQSTPVADPGARAAKNALIAAGVSAESIKSVDRGGVSANAWVDTRYGYAGVFRDASTILDVNWGGARFESFGIAPNRTIWHAWPGSGEWKEMPHNGKADNVGAAAMSGSYRSVSVWVNNSGYWCTVDTGNGRWSRWAFCV
ncbi:hypothetical protein ACH4RG_20565 [Streptomyces sp. NPDC021019]|uniref:hypothetical protein n=1 Tax=Streptomyces sp. NPDC021019 TaxID=3365108 RepID=UPI0037B50FAB